MASRDAGDATSVAGAGLSLVLVFDLIPPFGEFFVVALDFFGILPPSAIVPSPGSAVVALFLTMVVIPNVDRRGVQIYEMVESLKMKVHAIPATKCFNGRF